MNVAENAILSMNYFFLRTLTDRMNIEAVSEELDGFLVALSENPDVSDTITDGIAQEMQEGNYFGDKDRDTVQRMVEEEMDRLIWQTGVDTTPAVDLYMACYDKKGDWA